MYIYVHMYICIYAIYMYIYVGLYIWTGERRILPELPHLQSKHSPEV